jgi:flagellar hook-length control protein FliK
LAASGARNFSVAGAKTYLPPEKPLSFKTLAQNGQGAAASASDTGEAGAATGAVQAAPAAQMHGRMDADCAAERYGPGLSANADAQMAAAPASTAIHAAGLAPAGVAQQVSSAIQAAMPPVAARQSAPPAHPLPGGRSEAVKAITIALEPEGLGTVAIELSLNGSELGVKLQASDPGAALLLRLDGSALNGLLQSAGYTAVSLTVHAAPPQPQPAGWDGQPAAQGQGQGQTFGGGAQGQGGQASNKRQERGENFYGRPEKLRRDPSLYV